MTYAQNASGVARQHFDGFRPRWLTDPDFVPVDVDAADLVHPHDTARDMTRPELGAVVELLDFGPVRRGVAYHDEIDEPYDHRVTASGYRSVGVAYPPTHWIKSRLLGRNSS
jgi:hypothetical protein